MSKSTARYCVACEDLFNPEVSKIAKYCSADCAYDHAGIQTEKCPICDDVFDPKFAKSFVSCGCVKTEVLPDPNLPPEVWKAIAEAESVLSAPENAKKRFEMRAPQEIG